MKSYSVPGILIGVILLLFVLRDTSLTERVSLFVAPSAEKAYGYGMRHFNSLDPAAHNLSDAAYFLFAAERLDPAYPYVHHQLARIYFLRAEYPQALAEINLEIAHDPEKTRAEAFYMRGLIEGYLQDYPAAVKDYKQFIELNPGRWEGRTDYAWVLIKTGDLTEALSVIDTGLATAPQNPWLLSMRATILFEEGRYKEALPAARNAQDAVRRLTEEEWLKAYPGNAPDVAAIGLKTLRDAAQVNLEKIERAATEHGIHEGP